MGDCASRPKEDEEKKHVNEKNSPNDNYFIYKISSQILENPSIKSIKTADDQDKVKESLAKVKKQIQELKKKLNAISSVAPAEGSCLMIEIQKGKDIIPSVPCFYDAQPFVQVVLEPVKMTYTTTQDKAFIPTWYELFTHKIGVSNIENIVIKVNFKTRFGQIIPFGSCKLSISELINQDIIEKWVSIQTETIIDGNPELKIRAQALLSEYEMNKHNKKLCEELLPKAKELKKHLKSMLENCEEILL
ncbi:hypothetical protein SteCoe_17144 [Stentor coeruleus]|uniref:C2 domain-containing protein n=1 Tax=Stentor coeruleus TaxID=5963 RepID=A0A1R2BZN0_9CILI|nr:hypothetical protein SteCoe_17144 [Stentor coeruleus]